MRNSHYPNGKTHIEGLENPVEFQLPGGKRPSVAPRTEASGYHIPIATLNQLPPNVCHDPRITVMSVSRLNPV